MKLGVFLPNGQNGYILSERSPQYVPTFAHMLAITQEAERLGLDFVLSMIKYRGFEGSTGYWSSCLDSIAMTSGLAAATSRIDLYATVPVLGVHPAIAARMIATLEDISGGRAGVNIVTGWNKPEYDQMGLWPGANYHDRRYELCEEYVQIMRALWRDGRVTHHGEFYQLEDCVCAPTAKREIPIVSAGQSPKGIAFTARHAEYNFVFGGNAKLKRIAGPLGAAAEAAGRQVGMLALVCIIAAATDQEAAERTADIVAGADKAAISGVIRSASMDTNPAGTSQQFLDGVTAPVEEGNLAFMGFPVIHGSYDTVVRKIVTLEREVGVNGLLMTFPDFVPAVREFGEHVLPQLRALEPPRAAA